MQRVATGEASRERAIPRPAVMVVLVTALVAMILFFGTSAAGGEKDEPSWAMPRGNAQRTGLSQFSTEGNYGLYKWRFEPPSRIIGDLVVDSDGTIIFTMVDNDLYALDEDMNLERLAQVMGNAASSPVIGSDGTIYLGTTQGDLHAIDPSGGSLWSLNLTDKPLWSPVIAEDGTVYVIEDTQAPVTKITNVLWAISPEGDIAWNRSYTGYSLKTATLALDGTVYVTGDGIEALYPNGTLRWEWGQGTVLRYFVTVGPDGTVYSPSDGDGNSLNAFHPDGTMLWSTPLHGDTFDLTDIAIGPDGTIYIGSGEHYLHALYPNGTQKWEFEAAWSVYDIIVSSDGTVYFGDAEGYFYALSPEGELKWVFYEDVGLIPGVLNNILQGQVIGPDGTIYARSAGGFIYALGGGFQRHDVPPIGDGGPANSTSPMLHGQRTHTNSYPVSTEDVDGTFLWEHDPIGYNWDPPAIGPDGTLYFGDNWNNLYAVGPDGLQRWSVTLDSSVGTPAVSKNGTVVAAEYHGTVHAFHPSGQELWTYEVDGWIGSSPVIDDEGLIYICTVNGLLLVLNPHGTLRMTMRLGTGLPSTPAIADDGTIYLTTDLGLLYAIEADGTVRWTQYFWSMSVMQPASGVMATPPCIGPEGNVYICYEQTIWAYSPLGELLWNFTARDLGEGEVQHERVNWLEAPAVATNGMVYVAARCGDVYEFDPGGSLRMTIDTGEPIWAPVAVDAGDIVMVCHHNSTIAYNPDGSERWTYRLFDRARQFHPYDECHVPPVVSTDGVVYISFHSSGIHALGHREDGDGDGARTTADEGDGDWAAILVWVFLALSALMFVLFVRANMGRASAPAGPEREVTPAPLEQVITRRQPPYHPKEGDDVVQDYPGSERRYRPR